MVALIGNSMRPITNSAAGISARYGKMRRARRGRGALAASLIESAMSSYMSAAMNAPCCGCSVVSQGPAQPLQGAGTGPSRSAELTHRLRDGWAKCRLGLPLRAGQVALHLGLHARRRLGRAQRTREHAGIGLVPVGIDTSRHDVVECLGEHIVLLDVVVHRGEQWLLRVKRWRRLE